MTLIDTRAVIPADPRDVFAVLADFARYPEWNPLNPRMEGDCKVGARAAATIFNPARPAQNPRLMVTVTEVEVGRKIAWVGSVPLLFRGAHAFELTPHAEGTALRHSEKISGLAPLLYGEQRLIADFTPYYEALNQALAARVKAVAAAG